ncbi:MAG: choice-of-anchor J domain-containing protein [Saprospiraceae bacterium]|nr:choice-of-anchor J domain-containing protein [Saprospiraceae bacterium]
MERLILLLIALFFGNLSASSQIILQEDFENGWPADFLLVNVDGLTPDDPDLVGLADSAWSVRYISQAGFNSTTAFSVSWYVNDAGPSDDWMILPAITVDNNTVLSWTGMAITSSGNFRDRYQVAISTAGTDIADFEENPLLFDVGSLGEEITPQDRSVNLSDAGYTGQTVHIAFRNFTAPYDPNLPVGPGNGGNELMIDNIRIEANVVGLATINPQDIQMQLSPNPATATTLVGFQLKEASEVTMTLADATGRIIRELSNEYRSSGFQEIEVDLSGLATGNYLIRLQTDQFLTSTRLQKI